MFRKTAYLNLLTDLDEDNYLHSCNCPESLELQAKLILHLLKHVMKKRKRLHQAEAKALSTIDDEDMSHDYLPLLSPAGDVERNSMTKEPSSVSRPEIVLRLTCDQCPKTFKSRRCLVNHVIDHKQEKTFACDFPECKKAFSCKSYLSMHKLQVHRKRMCEICSMMVTRNHMSEHIRIQHSGPNLKTIKCTAPGCKKSFRSYHSLRYHRIAAHSTERPFMCEFCSKTFPTEGNMKNHRRRHTDPNR